jgi:hypothetical protein
MKFRCEHVFRGIELGAYETLYFDEPFNIALCQATGLGRALVKLEKKDGRLERAVKVTPQRELPGPMAKIIGSGTFEYTEFLDYHLGSFAGTWRTEPGMLKDKILSAGTFSFAAVPGGVRRVVAGEVKVKIFGLGGVLEAFVVADVEKSYARAAEFTQRWVEQGQATAEV